MRRCNCPRRVILLSRYLVDRARDRLSQILRGGSDLIGGSGGCSASCDVICSDALPPGETFDVIHVGALFSRVELRLPPFKCVAGGVCGGGRWCCVAWFYRRSEGSRRHDGPYREQPRRFAAAHPRPKGAPTASDAYRCKRSPVMRHRTLTVALLARPYLRRCSPRAKLALAVTRRLRLRCSMPRASQVKCLISKALSNGCLMRVRTAADAPSFCASQPDSGGSYRSKLHTGARRRRATWSAMPRWLPC